MSRKPILTEPQERHIETTLWLVDKAVQRVEFVLERTRHHSGPSGIVSSLDETTLGGLRRLLARLQQQAVALHRRYGFRSRRLSLERVLDAELSHLWEMLEDCRPGRMQGYGPMEAEIARELEQEVAAMLEMVHQARALLLAAEKSPREEA